jgi:membrane-associated protease RseP (regulator of RpoE activity)
MRLQIIVVGMLVAQSAVTLAVDPAGPQIARSHIQPVSEVVAAERGNVWSGLVTSRAPALLREHLQLERGAGLVVDAVAPGSQAETAGLRPRDVLVAIDGQLLVLPDQLSALLAESGPDAPLECRVVRGGREQRLSLRRPAARTALPHKDHASSAAVAPRPLPMLRPTPSTLALLPAKPSPKATPVMVQGDGTLVQKGADYSLNLSPDAEPTLTVRDSQGLVVFNGSIATPQQRGRLPEAVRDRVADLERLRLARQEGVVSASTEQAGQAGSQRIGALDIEPVTVR